MIHSVRQIELMPLSTSGACLRSIGGIHGNDFFPSIFCFERKELQELSPRNISDAFVNTAKVFFFHVVDRKVFNDDGIKSVNKLTGFPMSKVFTLPGNAFMHTSNCLTSFSFGRRSLCLFRKFSLGLYKLFFFMPKKPWIFNFLACGKSGKGFKPHIDSDGRIDRLLNGIVLDDTGKSRIPFSGWGSSNSTGLDLPFSRAVQLNFNISNLGKLKGIIKQLESGLRVCERIISKLSPKAGIARFFFGLASTEKRTESKIYASGNILKALAKSIIQKGMLFFKNWNCFGLIEARKTFLFGLPRCFTLLKKIIIEPATGIKAFLKFSSLCFIRKNPIFESFSHVIYTLTQQMCNVTILKGRQFICQLKQTVFLP